MGNARESFTNTIVTLFVISIINVNCTNKNYYYESDIKTITIPVGKSITSNSLRCELTNLVVLETCEGSMIGAIEKIVFSHDGIHIMDKTQGKQIVSFDKHGNYVSSLSKKGHGPDEYILPRDFIIDNNSQTIEILDHGSKDIILYNLNGDFHKRIHHGFTSYGFAKNEIGSYIFFLSNTDRIYYGDRLLNHNLVFYNSIEGIYHELDPFPNQDILNAFSAIPNYGFSTSINGQLLYRHYGDPIIYTIMDDVLQEEWFLDFGDQLLVEDKITRNDFNQNKILSDYGPKSGLVYWIPYFIELEEFVLISYVKGQNYFCNLTDKENFKPIFQSESIDFINMLLNLNEICYVCSFQGLLCVAIESFNLLDTTLYQKLLGGEFGKSIQSLRALKETDNPIILFYSLTNRNI